MPSSRKGAQGDIGSHRAEQGHKERAVERKVAKSSLSGRGGIRRVVESRVVESMGQRGAQGDVGSRRAEGGRKERSIEWSGAESSSRGRGAEKGWDLLSHMGEAKGRKTRPNERRVGGAPS